MTDLDRLLASPHFRWMPGMLLDDSSYSRAKCRVTFVGTTHIDYVWSRRLYNVEIGTWLRPDLEDAATRGCLLQLAREAWGKPNLHCYQWNIGSKWIVAEEYDNWTGDEPRPRGAPTEAEALIACVLAAPEKP